MAQQNIMPATLNTLSHKMARQRRHKQNQLRLELLPAELLLTIFEAIPSCGDLLSLIIASPTCRATFHTYKKIVLVKVTQAALGEAFLEACMLQHWQGSLNNYTEDEDDNIIGSKMEDWVIGLGNHQTTDREDNNNNGSEAADPRIPAEAWPQGPYRHIQLKFLHDYEQHAIASPKHQIQAMKNLLTAEDFEQVLSFHTDVIQPLSSLFGESLTPEQEFYTEFGLLDSTPLRRTITTTERQRIMRTFYRFQICCRLYGPHVSPGGGDTIDMGREHRQMMVRDFFGRFDAVENEEFDTVYAGLAFELHKAFNGIEYNRAWRNVLFDRAYESILSQPWTNNYAPITCKPLGLRGVTAGTLSLGLELFAKIKSAAASSPDEVAAVLVARNPPELDNWFWDALVSLPDAFHFSGGWPESWTDAFWEGDDVSDKTDGGEMDS